MLDFDLVLKNLQLPSPVTEISSDLLKNKQLKLFVKRDDLIHPEVSGNKWRKLYLNLLQARKENKNAILTFGGAFSNHIYATAAACQLLGFKSIGIIRGETVDVNNPTLNFAEAKGMQIVRVSKEQYKNQKQFLQDEFPDAFCIPEGGNNELGRSGLNVLANELKSDFSNQKIKLFVPIGTGCTIGGLIRFLPSNFSVIGINVLKNLGVDEELLAWIGEKHEADYVVNHDFHFGGYAKANEELVPFINNYSENHNLKLDPIYTAKMFYAIHQLASNNYFEEGSVIVALHTGGLQGIQPFNKHKGKKFGLIK